MTTVTEASIRAYNQELSAISKFVYLRAKEEKKTLNGARMGGFSVYSLVGFASGVVALGFGVSKLADMFSRDDSLDEDKEPPTIEKYLVTTGVPTTPAISPTPPSAPATPLAPPPLQPVKEPVKPPTPVEPPKPSLFSRATEAVKRAIPTPAPKQEHAPAHRGSPSSTYQAPNRNINSIKAGDTTLADFLGFYEAGAGEQSYSAFNRGTNGADKANKKIPQEKPVDRMTIGEVMRDQSLASGHPKRLFAVGKYQLIPDTMKDAVAQLKLNTSTVFDAKTQDYILSAYLISKKRSRLFKFITGNPTVSLDQAQNAMAAEWASMVNTRGVGDYDSKHNKAHTTVQAVRQILLKARARYQHFVSMGHDPNDALNAAIGSQLSTLSSNEYALSTVQSESPPPNVATRNETSPTVQVALSTPKPPRESTVTVTLDPPPKQNVRVRPTTTDPTLTQMRDPNGRVVRTS